MYLTSAHLISQERERRRRLHLCFYCGDEKHMTSTFIVAREAHSRTPRNFLPQVNSLCYSYPRHFAIRIKIHVSRKLFVFTALDSGAEGNFISQETVNTLPTESILYPPNTSHSCKIPRWHASGKMESF